MIHKVVHKAEEKIQIILIIHPDPAFDGDGGPCCRNHRGNKGANMRRLLHQAGPETPVLHTIGRTTAIEVDLVIAGRLPQSGTKREGFRLGTTQLQGYRVLGGAIAQVTVHIPVQERACRDHFGIEFGTGIEKPVEKTAMPVCPVHHGGHRNFSVFVRGLLIHRPFFIINKGMRVYKKQSLLLFFLLCLAGEPAGVLRAQEKAPVEAVSKISPAFRSTEYPLPRFVSLGADEVFVRTGPGQKYPVEWAYKRKGLPVEIILEYDIWRKIRDFDGQVGWVHHTLLNGRRTAFVTVKTLPLRKNNDENSTVMAYIAEKAVVDVVKCDGQWCLVNASGYKGWVPQKLLWGVYESEVFD